MPSEVNMQLYCPCCDAPADFLVPPVPPGCVTLEGMIFGGIPFGAGNYTSKEMFCPDCATETAGNDAGAAKMFATCCVADFIASAQWNCLRSDCSNGGGSPGGTGLQVLGSQIFAIPPPGMGPLTYKVLSCHPFLAELKGYFIYSQLVTTGDEPVIPACASLQIGGPGNPPNLWTWWVPVTVTIYE